MTREISLVIDRPDLQTWQQRSLYGLITLLLWVLWVYLWTPLLSLLAWVLGIRIFVVEMLLPANMTYVQELFLYGQVVLLMVVVMLAWSRYNIWRFRDNERRTHQPSLTPEDEAAYYGVDPALIHQLRKANSAIVHYDEHDRLIAVRE